MGRCSMGGIRFRLVLASVMLALAASLPARAESSYTFKYVAGLADFDLTLSYDPLEEKRIISEIGSIAQGGRILLWWLACGKTVAIYKPFTVGQGGQTDSPVLCVERVYSCDPSDPEKGNVYRGYLFLQKGFDLSRPVSMTLGNRTIKGVFVR